MRPTSSKPVVSRAALWFADAAALLTLVTVGLGSVVCATRSGFDCHSWPGCYDDRFAPGAADIANVLVANPALEMVHRVIAMSTGGVLIVTAVLVWFTAAPRIVKLLPLLACVAAGGSALFGRAAVLGLGVDALGAAVDLLCALVAMAAALYTAVALRRNGQLRVTPVGKSAALAALLLTVMYVTGQFAAGFRSFTRCLSWPILWLASDDDFGIQLARTALAVSALVVIALTIRAALRTSARTFGVALTAETVAVLVLAVAYRATAADGGLLGIAFCVVSVLLLWTLLLLSAWESTSRS